MGEIIITDTNFDDEVLKSTIPVLVDFWATWCGPCQMISPIISEIAKNFEGKMKVGKLNVDENPATPLQFGISSIPTLLIFKNGQVVKKMVGFLGKPKLLAEVKAAIEQAGD